MTNTLYSGQKVRSNHQDNFKRMIYNDVPAGKSMHPAASTNYMDSLNPYFTRYYILY